MCGGHTIPGDATTLLLVEKRARWKMGGGNIRLFRVVLFAFFIFLPLRPLPPNIMSRISIGGTVLLGSVITAAEGE